MTTLFGLLQRPLFFEIGTISAHRLLFLSMPVRRRSPSQKASLLLRVHFRLWTLTRALLYQVRSSHHVSVFQIGSVFQQFEAHIRMAFLGCAEQRCPIILKTLNQSWYKVDTKLTKISRIRYEACILTPSSALTSAPWLISSRTKCIFPLVAARMRAVLPFYCRNKSTI